MIAELLEPCDVDCLARTAVELWQDADVSALSGRQLQVLHRVRNALLAEHLDQPAPHAEVAAQLARTVWVLRRWDRHADEITLHADEESALGTLAQHVRSSWGNVAGRDGVPDEPPRDDRQAGKWYYGSDGDGRPDEGYCIYEERVVSGADTTTPAVGP